MYKKIGITGLSIFFSMSIYATDSIYGEDLPLIWSSIITLSGGPAWANPGQNQYLYPTQPPLLIDYFSYNSQTGILATGEIFFGLQRIIQPGLLGELGIGLAGATDAKTTGVIDVNGTPSVTTYGYKIDHGRAELKGKLISNYFKRVQPYISGSFGAGFNNSHAYVPITVNQIIFPPSWFASSTNIAFSYTLGAGVQTMLNPNWQVGIGYEFADWGKNYLGADPSSLLFGPGLTHLYTNELLFSLSYLF
jgi:hypothetical protein